MNALVPLLVECSEAPSPVSACSCRASDIRCVATEHCNVAAGTVGVRCLHLVRLRGSELARLAFQSCVELISMNGNPSHTKEAAASEFGSDSEGDRQYRAYMNGCWDDLKVNLCPDLFKN